MKRGGAVYFFMSEGQRSRSPGVNKYLTAMIPFKGPRKITLSLASKAFFIYVCLSTPIHKTILITTQCTLHIMYFAQK